MGAALIFNDYCWLLVFGWRTDRTPAKAEAARQLAQLRPLEANLSIPINEDGLEMQWNDNVGIAGYGVHLVDEGFGVR